MRTTKRKVKGKLYFANQGWQVIGGKKHFFRSGWEVKYARHLEFLKKRMVIEEWEYEPKIFWFNAIKRGTRSYLPDFRVTMPDGSWYWVEVKGYMDQKSRTKISRFKKYYPDEDLRVVSADWFNSADKAIFVAVPRETLEAGDEIKEKEECV
jgi:hypothetical protein